MIGRMRVPAQADGRPHGAAPAKRPGDRETDEAGAREQEGATPGKVWAEYEKGVGFKQGIDLYDTVKVNEDFYIGKQWEGVQSNGLPTPVFNYIKRIVLFLVASTATDNVKIAPTLLNSAPGAEQAGEIVGDEFEALFERSKLGTLVRLFMKNAAVDGDACLYAWFDPDVETGQPAKGALRTEILENTRVIFGDPTSAQVQEQPWIIVSRRERVSSVREQVRQGGGDPGQVTEDTDEAHDRFDAMADGLTTTLVKFWKQGGTVWCVKTTQGAVVRRAWDTGQQLYPLVWMNWDRVHNCYHGQAAVTGLIPNQIFVNKMFAMTMISLMTTAYPKVVYDKSKISQWDSGVGKAIGVNLLGGGSLADVARTIDPAAISPQVSQFIELAISLTKEFMGATDAALGNVKPDNTSAIIAIQKASQVPMELTKQDLYQALEELGYVWLDLMRAYYGVRYVDMPTPDELRQAAAAQGMAVPERMLQPFDFSSLDELSLSLKLDVGGSAYWSEIAQMNTLDNLLLQGHISIVDYLERLPNGYLAKQQDLIDSIKAREQGAPAAQQGGDSPVGAAVGQEIDPALAAGYQTLERKLAEQDAAGLLPRR